VAIDIEQLPSVSEDSEYLREERTHVAGPTRHETVASLLPITPVLRARSSDFVPIHPLHRARNLLKTLKSPIKQGFSEKACGRRELNPHGLSATGS
jgi:hypothetical protein